MRVKHARHRRVVGRHTAKYLAKKRYDELIDWLATYAIQHWRDEEWS